MGFKRVAVSVMLITALMLLFSSCASENASFTKQASIFILDDDGLETFPGYQQIEWTANIPKYNFSGENDALRLISHTRNTGVVFEEGQKFSFSIGEEKREFEYCSDDSGEICEIVFNDDNGSSCTLSVNKNGDFIRFINGNEQLDNGTFLSEDELHNKAMSYLKHYNKNLWLVV